MLEKLRMKRLKPPSCSDLMIPAQAANVKAAAEEMGAHKKSHLLHPAEDSCTINTVMCAQTSVREKGSYHPMKGRDLL